MNLKKPKFWDKKKPNLISLLLRPISIFPSFINSINFKKEKIRGIKTICVGNIYLGGTGKTPTCITINNILEKSGYKSTFVKKFYSNQKDEQNLLKKYGNLILKKERKNALKSAKSKKFDFAICDDGLQDTKVDYDLKIVCFNFDNFIGNGQVIPAGPLREKIENLKKYDLAIINGNGEKINKIEKILKKFNRNIKIFKGKYKIDKNLKNINKKKFIAFSGIGNNETFIKTLKKNKFKVIKIINFPDHYKYNNLEILKLKKEARQKKCEIITTEKDILRLSKKNKKNINFVRTRIEINKKNKFISCLSSI